MTKYDLLRKRIAPLAFVLALGLIAYDACDKKDRTHATIVLDFGAAVREVRSVEAEVWMNGEQVTQFRREAASADAYIGPARFETSLPDTDGELRIDVELRAGARRHVIKTLHVDEGATVSIRLEHDLLDAAP